MTNRKKVEYLKRFKGLDLSIDQMLEDQAMRESRATRMTPPLTGMSFGGSGPLKRFAK